MNKKRPFGIVQYLPLNVLVFLITFCILLQLYHTSTEVKQSRLLRAINFGRAAHHEVTQRVAVHETGTEVPTGDRPKVPTAARAAHEEKAADATSEGADSDSSSGSESGGSDEIQGSDKIDLPWGTPEDFPFAKLSSPYHWDMKQAWQNKSMPRPKRLNFNTSFMWPPAKHCPTDRFMYVTAGYGQHNNQLIALMNALVMSKILNRTLVIGDFIYMHRKDGKPSTFLQSHLYRSEVYERRFLDVRLLYDMTAYSQDYCFVYRQDFFTQNPPPHGAHCYKPKKESIRMFDVVCTKKIHKRRQRGHRMILKAVKDVHRLFYFPEIYWYLPTNYSRDYSRLQPSKPIRDEVDKFKREKIKTQNYTAVHLRNLEGGCQRMMLSLLWAINATDAQRRAAIQQCEMAPNYIREAQHHFGRPKQIVFLATDGQDKALDNRILNWGGVQYTHPTIPHNSLFSLAVDFWIMVEADVFVPNILSSVDWNVCAVRKAHGKECYFFFTDPHVTP